MKRIIAFILAAMILITVFVPAYAEEETVTPEAGISDDAGTEDETVAEDETQDPPESETEEEKVQEYYYITQEEFEKYREEYFEELTTSKLLAAIGFQGLESFSYMFLPLTIPILIFVPFVGALATGIALVAPFQAALTFGETFTGALYIMFHRNQMYKDFSTDYLYAQWRTEIDEETGEYIIDEETGEYIGHYEILFKDPEDDARLWTDCLPVAIKDN